MDKDTLFWIAIRRALLAMVKAIEVRYLKTPTKSLSVQVESDGVSVGVFDDCRL